VPIVGIAFAAWDIKEGLLSHAFNEALWPLSEAWK
jgi:hypothetical protein